MNIDKLAEYQKKLQTCLPNAKLHKELEEQNEIVELLYIGEVQLNMKVFRQVLVVKRRECQMMLTNGFNMILEDIQGTSVDKPRIIRNNLLSEDRQTLILYYTHELEQTNIQIRVFDYSRESKTFEPSKKHEESINLCSVSIEPDSIYTQFSVSL